MSRHAGPSHSSLSFLSIAIASPAPHLAPRPAPAPAPSLPEAGSGPEHVLTFLSLLHSCGSLRPEQLPQILFLANASLGLKAQVSHQPLCPAFPNFHGASLGIHSSVFRQLFVITASVQMQKMQHVSHRKVLAACAVPGTMPGSRQAGTKRTVPTPITHSPDPNYVNKQIGISGRCEQ